MTNYKVSKPKMTSMEIVKMMRDEKGITFKYISEEDAAGYLSNVNNYMRTASYRKNYTKVQGGKNNGKYENLDFAYLKELSTLDMYLRFVVAKMCLDIEHALKVKLLQDIENDTTTDGYSIVKDFFDNNPNIIRSLEGKTKSPFTGDLIQKYFTINTHRDNVTGKLINTIVSYDDCPIWVALELLSYGEFLKLYTLYYKNNQPINENLLHLVRSLRNGTAHNNCMLANLGRHTSTPPAEIKMAIKKIPDVTKSQRQKNLSTRPMLEFVVMLYVYDKIVSEKVKQHHMDELKDLFFNRMIEKKHFFKNNALIKSNYSFACIMINSLVK